MITVAVVQMRAAEDMKANYEKAEALITEAVHKGACLVVLPECFNYVGTPCPESQESITDGECYRRMSALAEKYGIWLHAGSIREKTESKPYNTSMLFSPRGEMVAKYSKIHLSDMRISDKWSRESDRIQAGDKIVVADTEIGKIGMSICYDLRFPELYRLMADKGAQIICHPACFNGRTGAAHWEILLRSIAIHNSCYVLASNQCGNKPTNGKPDWGHSCIIDPWGTVIADAGDTEGVAVAEIDLDYCTELKGRIGSLNNRRNDIYRIEEK